MKAAPTAALRAMSRSSGLSGGAAEGGPAGSSAMPQVGQGPGAISLTSGHIGHTHSVPGEAFSLARPESQPPGSASNLAAQEAWQKWKVLPPCVRDAAARAGSTVMPQTGSTAVSGVRAMGRGRTERSLPAGSPIPVPRRGPFG